MGGYRVGLTDTQVAGGADPASYLERILPIGESWEVRNYGVAGQDWTAMNTNDQLKVDQYVGPGRTRNVCVALEWSNAFNDSASVVATEIGRATTWATDRAAAGFTEIILVSPIRRAGVSTDAGYAAKAAEAHAHCLANFRAMGYTSYVNLYDNPAFSDTTNTRYYHADQIHLTSAGSAEIASGIAAVL
jgi:hypothetical protein